MLYCYNILNYDNLSTPRSTKGNDLKREIQIVDEGFGRKTEVKVSKKLVEEGCQICDEELKDGVTWS
jgi:hypothetical protein